VRNEELFDRVKKERTNLKTTKSTTAKGIGHILRRKCLQNTLLKER
jgi:hypothetical protein